MQPSRTSSWTLLALAALAVLFASAESRASCGDYLQMNRNPGGDTRHSPSDRSPTCHGPGCRQGEPGVPIAPPLVQLKRAPVDADHRDTPPATATAPSHCGFSLQETPRFGVGIPPLRPPRD